MAAPSPRLSLAAREAIIRRLTAQNAFAAVAISRILRDVRADCPALAEDNDDLIRQIVIEATDLGYAVDFDERSNKT